MQHVALLSPFDELVVPVSEAPLDTRLRERWVMPLYMAVPDDLNAVEGIIRSQFHEIDRDLIQALLSQFNWRPRGVGAFLVALDQRTEFEDLLGRLLLRSDVCYAGRNYCLALARLNTSGALNYLEDYLRYYLTRRDLYFDQAVALAAVRHLDHVNGTRRAEEFGQLWADFVADKPNWDLDATSARFDAAVRDIASLSARCG